MITDATITLNYSRAVTEGLIISGMLVQGRAVPKHRSTHISNYQSIERESYEHDEN